MDKTKRSMFGAWATSIFALLYVVSIALEWGQVIRSIFLLGAALQAYSFIKYAMGHYDAQDEEDWREHGENMMLTVTVFVWIYALLLLIPFIVAVIGWALSQNVLGWEFLIVGGKLLLDGTNLICAAGAVILFILTALTFFLKPHTELT